MRINLPKLKRANTTIRRTIRSTLAKLRFGKITFEESELETMFVKIVSSKLTSLKMLEEIITRNIDKHGEEKVFGALKKSITTIKKTRKQKPLKNLYVAGLKALEAKNVPLSLDFGELYLDSINDERGIISMILAYQRCGHIEKPYNLLSQISDSHWKKKQKEKLEVELNLLKKGVAYDNKIQREWASASRNIMYHINQSLPHHSSGYAIRTQALLKSLKKKNWHIKAYARIGYPNDRYDYIGTRIVESHSNVEGIEYYFTPSRKKSIAKLNIEQYQKENVKLLIKQAKKFKPTIMHCASNYSCGLAGTAAAKLIGIPSIYEIRGLWHVTRTAKQPEYDRSDHFKMIENLEIQAAKNADHVFAITSGVKDVLLKNEINEEKITLLPNAVDTTRFKPSERNQEIEKKLKLEGKITIGYIGSFTDYEGLDYLLKASVNLKEKYNQKFKVLLIGDGAVFDDLKRLCMELKLEDTVHFTGRIDHRDILDYYSVIDIAAYPRKGTKVCEIVSPLKPLEAMAMGKTIIASNVKALSEMIKDNETGLIHEKDNVDDLTKLLEVAINDKELNIKLGKNGLKWVTINRTWNEISKKVEDVYEKLIRQGKVRNL